MAWKLYIAQQARSDIQTLWAEGLAKFGLQVANEYDRLIEQALVDLLEDPHRLGVHQVTGHSQDLLAYPLVYSKREAKSVIKKPAHAVFFFLMPDYTVAIATIARASREHHIGKLNPPRIERRIEDE